MGLVNPLEAIRKNGYYVPCPSPEMKTTDKSLEGRLLVLLNEYLECYEYMVPQADYDVLHELAYRWLMRDERLRQEMVEDRERVHGKRLGTVNIWDSILYDLVESLECELDKAAPEGYYFGAPYEEAGFKGFYPNHLLEAPDGGRAAYDELIARRRST